MKAKQSSVQPCRHPGDAPLNSVVETVGETPLVELGRLTRGLEGRILAKLEYFSPGFSKKDRVARQIIEDAEGDGTLRRGQTVVELTSGNTGTGLAIVCAVKGYPFVAVMSKGNSMERARMMSALGAEVILVDQLPESKPNHGIQGGGYAMAQLPLLAKAHIDGYLTVSDHEAVEAARRLAREEGIFAGISSGANIAAALELLRTTCTGQTVCVLVNDSGLKYLSTGLWK